MPGEQADLIHSFHTFIPAAEQGAVIPTVDENDLKAVHELGVERKSDIVAKVA